MIGQTYHVWSVGLSFDCSLIWGEPLSIPLLGQLPLDMTTQVAGDKGVPIVLENTRLMILYKAIAQQISQTLASMPLDVIRAEKIDH